MKAVPAEMDPPALFARLSPTVRMVDATAARLYLRRSAVRDHAVEILREAAPDYGSALEAAGEAIEEVSAGIVDVLIRCLSADGDAILRELAASVRGDGRRRCEQGLALETLMEVLSIHKTAFMEDFEAAAASEGGGEEAVIVAQRRLDYLVERLALKLTQGYFDSVEERFQAEHRELRALISIARAVNSSLELADVAEAGLAETVKAMAVDAGALWVTDPEGDLVLVHTVGVSEPQAAALRQRRPEDNPRVAAILRGSLPQALSGEERIEALPGDWHAIVSPLRSKGRLQGLMAIVSFASARTFSEGQVGFVAAVADHFGIAIEHASQHRREARTDFMTGLGNRPEFERAIERAIAAADRHGRPLSLLLFDLDRLKDINDEHGHHAGDEAIRAVAEVIREQVRASDTCARMGGDEFAVAMPEAGSAQAQDVAERVQKALAAINGSGRMPMPVEVSTGYAERTPGMGWPDLFQAADAELYREKRRRRRERARRAGGG